MQFYDEMRRHYRAANSLQELIEKVESAPNTREDRGPEVEALAILSDLVAWSKYSEAANITDIVNRADALLKKVNA